MSQSSTILHCANSGPKHLWEVKLVSCPWPSLIRPSSTFVQFTDASHATAQSFITRMIHENMVDTVRFESPEVYFQEMIRVHEQTPFSIQEFGKRSLNDCAMSRDGASIQLIDFMSIIASMYVHVPPAGFNKHDGKGAKQCSKPYVLVLLKITNTMHGITAATHMPF